jgi:hypothetical protein
MYESMEETDGMMEKTRANKSRDPARVRARSHNLNTTDRHAVKLVSATP